MSIFLALGETRNPVLLHQKKPAILRSYSCYKELSTLSGAGAVAGSGGQDP